MNHTSNDKRETDILTVLHTRVYTVVKVSDNAPVCPEPAVVSIFDIDPSRIINERDDDETCYYMCSIEGIDTVRPRV